MGNHPAGIWCCEYSLWQSYGPAADSGEAITRIFQSESCRLHTDRIRDHFVFRQCIRRARCIFPSVQSYADEGPCISFGRRADVWSVPPKRLALLLKKRRPCGGCAEISMGCTCPEHCPVGTWRIAASGWLYLQVADLCRGVSNRK